MESCDERQELVGKAHNQNSPEGWVGAWPDRFSCRWLGSVGQVV